MSNQNPPGGNKASHSMVDISQITGIRRYVAEYSSLESDYIFSHLTSDESESPFVAGPVRINGLVFCFVVSGYMKVDINLNSYKVSSNTLITATSSSIINVLDLDKDNLDAYVLVISPEFMRDINIDLNVIQASSRPNTPSRQMSFSHEDSELLQKYLRLLHLNTKENQDDMYIRSISRCLIASIVYQLLQFQNRDMRHEPSEEPAKPMNRRLTYVRDFMDLVHKHHKQERAVSFYADKLFITPKYLSLIIKESTGRSAAEWIDEFVILEAKNMLRFSRKNIQQIAYELNFSNQSSFGKYFKNLTGMSPSVYQRS